MRLPAFDSQSTARAFPHIAGLGGNCVWEEMAQGVVEQDRDGHILYANPAAQRILGLTFDQMQGRTSTDPRWRATREDGGDYPGQEHPSMRAMRGGEPVRGAVMGVFNPELEELRWVEITAIPVSETGQEKPARVVAVFEDITERKRIEQEREVLLSVVALVNTESSTRELVHGVLENLRSWAGVEAVALRLWKDDYCPYFDACGFSEEFLAAENDLRARDAKGQLVLGGDGATCLECLCGQLLKGTAPEGFPGLSNTGTFWTNDLGEVASQIRPAELTFNVRGRCLTAGWRSMALIPLKGMGVRNGLLQLEDTRPDRFDRRRIAVLERLAAFLAMGLAQRRTEEQLRASEVRWRYALEGAGEAVWEYDRVTGRATYSPQWKRMLGYEPDEIGPSIEDALALIHPDDRGDLRVDLQKVFDGWADVGSRRLRMKTKDGEWRWILTRGRVMERDAGGRPVRLVGTHADITATVDAEDALRESESRYRLAMDAAHLGMFRYDAAARGLWLNQRARSLAGWPEPFLPETELLARIHHEDRERTRRIMALAARNRGSDAKGTAELQLVGEDGTRWLRVHWHVSAEGAERPAQTIGTVEDTTESRRAELLLREQEYWLRKSQRLASMGSYVLDLKTGDWTSSEMLDEIFGIGARYEHTIAGWRALVHPADQERLSRDWQQALATKRQHFNRVFRIMRASDRQERWMLETAEIFYDGTGSPIRVAAAVQDITERKQVEDQLLQSQKMESVGRLAGGVAHDFNNLLTVINGYSETLLAKLSKSDPLRPGLREILGAGEKAAALTQQLLALSRRQMVQPKLIDLNSLLIDMERMLCRLISEDIRLSTVLQPDLGLIWADPGQINQVVLNLAVNARDAMPEGGDLKLKTWSRPLHAGDPLLPVDSCGGDYVALVVEDTGTGMPSEVLSHLFEPFFTTKPPGKGTGLGLSTVYGIVQQAAGFVRVESTPNAGTMFTVLFPQAICGPAEDGAHVETPKALLCGKSILVVEDHPDVRALVAMVLEDAGCLVVPVSSGDEALMALSQAGAKFDLMLTDMVMPGMPARALISRARRDYPGLRVLSMSGYTERQDKDLASITAFLPKPFSPDQLVSKIGDVLA